MFCKSRRLDTRAGGKSAQSKIDHFDRRRGCRMTKILPVKFMEIANEVRAEFDFEFVGLAAIAHVGPQLVAYLGERRAVGAQVGARPREHRPRATLKGGEL